MSSAPPSSPDSDTGFSFPPELGEAIMISAYLNFCFFVAEIAFVQYGPPPHHRHALDMMAHILTGPIAFLGFLNGGFLGSFAFFFSLWHFLCDSNRARPSLVRVLPTSMAEFWVWFESLWLLIHHWFIGTFKLLSTELRIPGTDTNAEPIRYYIRTWILGATLSHLSFGMGALGMGGASFVRIASVGFRMGAALTIVLKQFGTNFTIAYTWDLIWMSVILALTCRKAICAGSAETEHDDGKQRRATRLSRLSLIGDSAGAGADSLVRVEMEQRLRDRASARAPHGGDAARARIHTVGASPPPSPAGHKV